MTILKCLNVTKFWLPSIIDNIVVIQKKRGIKLHSVFLIGESMCKILTVIKKTLQDTLQCFFNTFLLGYFWNCFKLLFRNTCWVYFTTYNFLRGGNTSFIRKTKKSDRVITIRTYIVDDLANKYIFKLNNKSTRMLCELSFKLTINTLEDWQWRLSTAFFLVVVAAALFAFFEWFNTFFHS